MYSVVAATLLSVLAIASASEPNLEASQLPARAPTVTRADSKLFLLDDVPVSRASILGGSRILAEPLDAHNIVVFFVTKASLCWSILDEIFEYHALITDAGLPAPVEMAIVLDAESQEAAEHWYNSTALDIPVVTGIHQSTMKSLSRYQDQEFQPQLVVYDGRSQRILLRAALRTLTPEQYKKPVVDAVLTLLPVDQDRANHTEAGGRE